ncbi:MAG: flippase-like domain-containing protein [Chloroflexi bacterium]|nr:flippase-like domain-containing protein [Chloroflexota bacterium]MCC6893110.1 flippase-like domain-containing protein [Anaerolineae bacterium]
MKINKWFAVGFGIVISLVFLWFAFRNLNPAEVWEQIQQVNVGWLIAGALVYFIAVTIISLRWRFLLRSTQPVPLTTLIPLVLIGYMGNNLYPFRSGEILRVILLQRNSGIPVARAATTVIIERVFDGLVMLTFIAVSLLFVDVQVTQIRSIAMVATPIFLTAVVVFFVLAAQPNLLRRILHIMGRILPSRIHTIMTRLADEVIEGFQALRSPADLAGAVICSYGSWMVEAVVYWMVSLAFGLDVGYPVMLLTVGVVNLAGLIPASPGQIGVFEFFVSLVLVAMLVPEAEAHAYALVVHVVIWLPVTLAGFAFLVRQGLGWGAVTHARELEKAAG